MTTPIESFRMTATDINRAAGIINRQAVADALADFWCRMRHQEHHDPEIQKLNRLMRPRQEAS